MPELLCCLSCFAHCFFLAHSEFRSFFPQIIVSNNLASVEELRSYFQYHGQVLEVEIPDGDTCVRELGMLQLERPFV